MNQTQGHEFLAPEIAALGTNSGTLVVRSAAFMTYLRQPSTVLGLSALIGTLTALLTGQISWQAAIPAIAGALAAIALPDNAGAQIAIKDAASAAVRAEQAVSAPGAIAGAAQVWAQVSSARDHSLGSDQVAAEPTTLSGH